MSKLEESRVKYGISQQELADYLGVARTTIYRWEAGETEPSSANVQKMNEFFKEVQKRREEAKEMKNEDVTILAKAFILQQEELKRNRKKDLISKLLLIFSTLGIAVAGFFIFYFSCNVYSYYKLTANQEHFSINLPVPLGVSWAMVFLLSLVVLFLGYLIFRVLRGKRGE